MRSRSSWMTVGAGAHGAAGAALLLAFACSGPSAPTTGMLGDTPPNTNPTPDGSTTTMRDASPEEGSSAEGGTRDGSASDALGSAFDSSDGPSGDHASIDARDAAAVDASRDGGAQDVATAPSVCDPAHVWQPVQRVVSVTATNFARFGGVTPDELTALWTASDGTIQAVDRASRAGGFGAPGLVNSTPVALDRAGLSASGLSVVAVAADRTKFVGFERPSMAGTWMASSTLALANVNGMASVEVSAQFSEPVLSGDGTSFFFVMSALGAPSVVYESKWDTQGRAWMTGAPVQELASGDAASPTYPTGTSADGQTLFYFDGVVGHERAAWRATVSSPFTQFADEAAVPEAAPNFLCNTLFYQDSDSLGVGLFEAQ